MATSLLRKSKRDMRQENNRCEEEQCRICFGTENSESFIKPCLCTALVHRECLDEWRAQEQIPLSFSHCPTCKYQYQTVILEDTPGKKGKLRLLVARDVGGLFVLSQLCLAAIAGLLSLADAYEIIPTAWLHIASARWVGVPYYCAAMLICLVLCGLHECLALLGLCTRLATAGEAEQAPRRHHQHQGAAHNQLQRHHSGQEPNEEYLDDDSCDCLQACSHQSCECRPDCLRGTHCNTDCCESGCRAITRSGGSGPSSPADAAIVVVIVVVALIALLGAFACVAAGAALVRRIVRRHMRLLGMRSAAQRIAVQDLRGVPQHLLLHRRHPRVVPDLNVMQ